MEAKEWKKKTYAVSTIEMNKRKEIKYLEERLTEVNHLNQNMMLEIRNLKAENQQLRCSKELSKVEDEDLDIKMLFDKLINKNLALALQVKLEKEEETNMKLREQIRLLYIEQLKLNKEEEDR